MTILIQEVYKRISMKRIVTLAILLSITCIFAQNTANTGTNTNNTTNKTTDSKKKDKKALPEGFAAIKWGTPIKEAKKNIKGKLTYTDDKEVIISKNENIEYYYGFLYKKDDVEGKLYYVSLSFPYLSFDSVKKRYIDVYGEPNRENVKNNKGAIAWESDDTVIIIWVEEYERKPYSGRVVFISKKIAKDLDELYKKIFFTDEMKNEKKIQE